MALDGMLVGTPLYEEEDSGRGPSSFVPTKKVDPLWKQEVVDAEGRRRFHGAFTGGYSAGYFNTVGSAEGWAPKSFKSSRSNRNNQQQQTAEDFMDEEDLTSFGGKQLQTNSQYDSLGSTAADIQRQTRRAAATSRSVIPGDAPEEFVAPTTEGIGKQLLRLMGWREGQGVGPRHARKRKQLQSTDGIAQKTSEAGEPATRRYRSPLPPNSTSTVQSESSSGRVDSAATRQEGDGQEDDDPYAAAFLFAPKNTAVFNPGTGKDNFFGLGFDPFTGAPEFRNEQQQSQQNLSRTFLRSSERKHGAFGIGALEDEDDHEVYDHIERSDYDFETGGAEGESTQGKGRHGPTSALIGPSAASTSASAGEGIASGDGEGGKCSDGMPALVGFVVASRSSLPDKWYTAPAVPQGFRPFHEFKAEEGETGSTAVTSGNWVIDETTKAWRLEKPKPKPTEPKENKASGSSNRPSVSNLSAEQRGRILGEAAAASSLPSGANAVSVAPPPPRLGVGPTLMSINNPSMSASDRQKIAATLAAGSRFVKASDPGPATGVNQAEGCMPTELNGCFLPNEPAKQARLEAYYKEQHKPGFRKMDGAASEIGPWAGAEMTEWEVSREREEFAALIHGGAAAAEVLKNSQAASGGLQTGAQIAALAKATKAVRRSTIAWAPVKLLCKRFNVPDPYGGKAGMHGRPEDYAQAQTKELLSLPDEVYQVAHRQQDSSSTPSKQHRNTEEAKQPAAYSAAAEDVTEKPVPNGIFKAIFEESSSSETEGSEEEEQEQEEQKKPDRQNRTAVGASRGAMVAVDQDPLQKLFRESGRYDPLPGQSSQDVGDTAAGDSNRQSSRVASGTISEVPAVAVPQGSLKRGVYQQGGWLSRDPIPKSVGRMPPHSELHGTATANARGPMGRGMGATQPAWMTADTEPRSSGTIAVDRHRSAGSVAKQAPRSFNVQRPAGLARADAREQELRQAMIASAAGRERAARLLTHSSDLHDMAAGSSTASSDDDGSEDSQSEQERNARKKSKRTHRKEKKRSHKKEKKSKHKKKKKKSRSSRH